MKKILEGSRTKNARGHLLNLVVLAALAGTGLANWSAILHAQQNVGARENVSQEGEQSELKTVPLGAGIYMFSGDGGNVVAVVDDAETVLIDSGLESRVSELYQAIVQASHRPVTELVNTSGNIERAGGDAFFAAAGVTIIEQKNAERQLSSEGLPFTSIPRESDHEAGPLRSIYVDKMVLHQGSEKLRLVHYGPAIAVETRSYILTRPKSSSWATSFVTPLTRPSIQRPAVRSKGSLRQSIGYLRQPMTRPGLFRAPGR